MPGSSTIAETAKQRSLRVPLDHYRQPDPLVRWKFWLSLAAILLAAGYVTFLLSGQHGWRHSSPGQVASVHAVWNNDCQQCHVDFRPLGADAVDLAGLASGRTPESIAAHRNLVDAKCVTCHQPQQSPHHANQLAGEVQTCAACHQDHHGLDAKIARPADSHCTQCHAQMDKHRTQSAFAQPIENAVRFAAPAAGAEQSPRPHPAFRSLQHDPGNLKFNHWLHLQPGSSVPGPTQQKWSDLPADVQQRIAKTDSGLVRLECSNCHQPDASGQQMQPIAFEQHCRACHPLELKLDKEDKRVEVIPHGLQPGPLAAALDGATWAWKEPQEPAAAPTTDESGALPLIPGKTLGQNLAQKLGSDLRLKRDAAGLAVAIVCRKCHEPVASGGPLSFEPTNIPATWLRHAWFDHRAHQGVAKCVDCHGDTTGDNQPRHLKAAAGTLSDGSAEARDRDVVMIAGLAKCASCHSPTPTGAKATPARFDCAECHHYHSRKPNAGDQTPPANQSTHLQSAAAEPVMLVAYQPAASQPPLRLGSLDKAPAALDRVASCAGSSCHSDARPSASPRQSSLTTWLAADPHAQAYHVLWTARAREMTRLLAPPDATGKQPENLSAEQHSSLLIGKCIQCHATTSGPPTTAGIDDFPLGVHCDSCHGKSDQWLYAHSNYKTFDRNTPGFIDTKNFETRTKVCLPCHVGPNTGQAVDHDLIAAGHPRLNFEFHAYYEGLPAHWNRAGDAGRHHELWLAGQREVSSFRAATPSSPSDFALLDCAACHTAFRPEKWQPNAAVSGGSDLQPRPSLLERARKSAGLSDLQLHTPLLVAKGLLAEAAQPNGNFDDAAQAYLAVKAIATDLPPNAPLMAVLDKLGNYLGRDCFLEGDSRLPTPYDSPQRFDPTALAPLLKAVAEALSQS